MTEHWIRDENHEVHQVDLMTWARWFEEQDKRGEQNLRIVKRTRFADGTTISTVFLGLDHGWGRSQRPVLFETMIFGPGKGDTAWDFQERYCTEAQALEGHERARAHVRALGFIHQEAWDL